MNHKAFCTLTILSIIMTGCFQVSQTRLDKENDSSSEGPGIAKTEYMLVSPTTIESILVNVLLVPTTDASVQKLRSNKLALGAGDPALGIPADGAFSPLKGKIISEIYIDGCSLGLSNPTVKNRLFPKGTRDYEALFLTFTGRSPELEEIETLNTLNDSISDQASPAATCAAVLSSIDPLNRT